MVNVAAPPFVDYSPEHRQRLRQLSLTTEWQELLARGDALRRWIADVRVPPEPPGQQAKANEYLRERNGARVKALIEEGIRDEAVLSEALGDWEAALAGDDPFPVVFLGFVLTLDCSFLPRCVYCNQLWVPRRLKLEDWKAVISEVAEPVPPYVYLTGGEPLILGAEVWGDQGIVAHAARLGCAVNINTNAALIKPHVALQMVKAGVAKLHISIDTAEKSVQDALFGNPERTNTVLTGLLNIQIAREVLGAGHPRVHINCVLTARNLFEFPELLRFLLEMRPALPSGFDDFAIHLIPVGGSENALLRPTADEWKRFYTETWEKAERIWDDYQESVGVPSDDRKPLTWTFPFLSPYHRAEHGISLDEYCKRAAEGEYWQGALTDRCYVAPTQAYVLPDGSQHWCGAHAIRRPEPVGSMLEAGIRENIRNNIKKLADRPNHDCTGCAGATCVINQAAERNLKTQVREWLEEHELVQG
jgi:MoaA/NifB/PqqE/SkfB family radical SAM enzyme